MGTNGAEVDCEFDPQNLLIDFGIWMKKLKMGGTTHQADNNPVGIGKLFLSAQHSLFSWVPLQGNINM